MQPVIAALFFLITALLTIGATAGGNPNQKASVTIHLETDASDNPKFIFPHEIGSQTRYFRRAAEISARDILAYSPFPSAGGNFYGAAFRLKSSAASRLATITTANHGRWLITAINGRVVDGVMIDKRIEDGIVVAWDGLTLADIAVLDDEITRIGEENKKRKKP